jgi:hypothetical protein
VWAVKKFRPYLEGYRFVAVTDHIALKWLLRLKEPSGRLARWVLELQQHEFDVVYRSGKSNRIADALSRYPVEELASAEGPEDTVCQINVGQDEDVTNNPNTPEPDEWYDKIFKKVGKSVSLNRKFLIREGKLYKYFKGKDELGAPVENWKLCVRSTDRKKVLVETHDSPTAGHFGFKKTTKRVALNYFWPGWRRDVREYVRNCPVCQKFKVEQVRPAGTMHYRPSGGPWHTVSADLLGPFPRSRKGNKFIIAFQDQYSKWTEMAPLKFATAAQVAEKFKELVLLRYGSPEELIIDNGTQFCAQLFRDLAKDWNITCQYPL